MPDASSEAHEEHTVAGFEAGVSHAHEEQARA
jgi:hypothetical protein